MHILPVDVSPVIRRGLQVLTAALVIIFCAIGLSAQGRATIVKLFWGQPLTLVAVVALESLYILAKSLSWKGACAPFSSTTVRGAARVFLISGAIDSVFAPARTLSDFYKVWSVRGSGLGSGLRVLISYRLGSTLPYLIFGASLVIPYGTTLFLGILCAVFLFKRPLELMMMRAAGHVLVRIRQDGKTPGLCFETTAALRPFRVSIVSAALWTSLAILIDSVRSWLLFEAIVGEAPAVSLISFVEIWCGAYTIGTLSGVPAGLGTRDATLFLLVNNSALAHSSFLLFLAAQRITGELLSAGLGLLLICFSSTASKEICEIAEIERS